MDGNEIISKTVLNNNVKALKQLAREYDINIRYSNGQTLMHDAALTNAVDVIKWLKNNGADINIMDNQNQTPLDLAENSDGNLQNVKNPRYWMDELKFKNKPVQFQF